MERNRQADLSVLARKPFGDADLSALGRVTGASRGSRSPFSTTDADSSINLQRLNRVDHVFGALGRVDIKTVGKHSSSGAGSRSDARDINMLAPAAAQVERGGLQMPDIQATRNRNPKKSKVRRHPLEDSSVSRDSSMRVQPLSYDSPTGVDLFGNPMTTSRERDLFPGRSRSRESLRRQVFSRSPADPLRFQDIVLDDSAPKLDFSLGTDSSKKDSSSFGTWGQKWDFGPSGAQGEQGGSKAKKDQEETRTPTEVSATRLYLGNLPSNTTKRDIEDHFSAHGAGTITEIKLMNGFGFIEFDDPMDARDVVPAFHGSEFNGQRLVVQYARQARKQNSNVYSSTPGGAPIQSPFVSHVDYDRFRQLNSPPGQHISPLGNSQYQTQQRPSIQGPSMEYEPVSETQKKKTPFEHAECSFYLHYTIAEDRSGTADEVMSKRLAPLVDRHHRLKKDSNTKKMPAWQDDEVDEASSNPSYPPPAGDFQITADNLSGLYALAKGADRLHAWDDRQGAPRHADLKPENILVFPESTRNANGKKAKIRPYPSPGTARFQQVYDDGIQSSTHSLYLYTSDLDENLHEEKTRCPYPECGSKTFKDIKAHILAIHQPDRPEKCPVPSCEYATEGFARKYDQRRHTLTHFRGTLVCDFCPGYGTANEKSFNRADVFKRHLNKNHDVEQVPPRGRGKSKTQLLAAKPGKCSVCLEVFDNPQYLYDHLDACISDVVYETANVDRDDLLAIAVLNQRGFDYIKCMDAYFDADRHINVAVELLVDRQQLRASEAQQFTQASPHTSMMAQTPQMQAAVMPGQNQGMQQQLTQQQISAIQHRQAQIQAAAQMRGQPMANGQMNPSQSAQMHAQQQLQQREAAIRNLQQQQIQQQHQQQQGTPKQNYYRAQKRMGRDDGVLIPYVDERPTRFLRVEIDFSDEKDFMVFEQAIEQQPGFVHFTWESRYRGRMGFIGFIEFVTPSNAYDFLEQERVLDDTSCTFRTLRYVDAIDMPGRTPRLSEVLASAEKREIQSPLERLARKNQSTPTTLPTLLTETDERTPLQRLAKAQPNTSDPSATSEALQRLARNKEYSMPVRLKDDATSSVNPTRTTKVDLSKNDASGKAKSEYDPWRDHFD
jgi:hypothetical protein